MASNSCSYRNAQQASARLNQPEKVPVETILTLSTTSALSQVPASATAPALYI